WSPSKALEEEIMGRIFDRFTFPNEPGAPRYKYNEDTDCAYILIDEDFVKKRGMVIDQPELMPYYVEMEDRLGIIGVWLFDPNDIP
ncbi:MAG: hypothetical protein ACXABY_11875, partial [Candidatus Thorarchaeota archaeon]